jgi:hypothetical protein
LAKPFAFGFRLAFKQAGSANDNLVADCTGFPHTIQLDGTNSMEAHNQVRFVGFEAGATMCHFGGNGGGPDSLGVWLAGNPIPHGMIIPAGGMKNSLLKYIRADGTVYVGTYKNKGENTELTLE